MSDTSRASEGGPTGPGASPALRVLHLTAVEAPNYYLNNLASASDPAQVRFHALTLGREGGFASALGERGVHVEALGISSRLGYPRALVRLSGMVRRFDVNVIHGHLFEPSLLGALVARLHGRCFVTTRHHSDAVHRVPGALRRRAYLSVEGFVSRTASRIIAPAERVRQTLLREGVPASKIARVPYPQDPSRFESLRDRQEVRQELEMDGAVALVCVSRLHPEKGHVVLFDSLREVVARGRNVRLFLVGEGQLRPELETAVREKGLEGRVRFLGWRDDALSVMAAADAIVHPSLHEALPSAVIEAMALERPLVVTDVSGVRDIVGDGEFAAVVPEGNASALTDALIRTLDDLPGATSRARQGRAHVLREMGSDRVAQEHLACYRQALGERLRAAPSPSGGQ